MKQEYKDLIYLVSCAVNDTVPAKARVEKMNLAVLEQIAAFHKVESLLAYALTSAGVQNKYCTEAIDGAIRQEILWDQERQQVYGALNEAGIWYMPLKGSVLKDMYPQIGMRQMSDTDVLFDPVQAESVKRIMESLGYAAVHLDEGHHDDYRKDPFFHFEMHRMLFAPNYKEEFFNYYKDIENRLLPGEGYERHFSPEDFYLFMIAHCYKHFYWQGVGLRSLLDVYVFWKSSRDSIDREYLAKELAVLGLEDFEQKTRSLAEKVFFAGETEHLSEEEELLLEAYAESGMYGTLKRKVQIRVEKNGRARYLLGRIFLPMPDVARFYPFFYRHKLLLPMLPLYRLLRGKKKAAREWKAFAQK